MSISNFKKSNALSNTVDTLHHPLLAYANGEIEYHIFFKDAFLTKAEMLALMKESWRKAQIEIGKNLPQDPAVEQHVRAPGTLFE